MCKETLYAKHANISIAFRNTITWKDTGTQGKKKDTLVPSFLSCSHVRSHVRSHAGGRFARAYACRAVSRARAHVAITRMYQRVMLDARPILIPLIALLLPSHSPRISIFSLFRRGAPARAREATPAESNERDRKAPREDETREPWEITKSLAISRRPFISSRARESGREVESSVSRKMYRRNSRCLRHKNARTAYPRNDDVSNSTLYILTDVTLLS